MTDGKWVGFSFTCSLSSFRLIYLQSKSMASKASWQNKSEAFMTNSSVFIAVAQFQWWFWWIFIDSFWFMSIICWTSELVNDLPREEDEISRKKQIWSGFFILKISFKELLGKKNLMVEISRGMVFVGVSIVLRSVGAITIEACIVLCPLMITKSPWNIQIYSRNFQINKSLIQGGNHSINFFSRLQIISGLLQDFTSRLLFIFLIIFMNCPFSIIVPIPNYSRVISSSHWSLFYTEY